MGLAEEGTLSITAGGWVSNIEGNIGASSGSSGTATVDGEGSAWINSSVLTVGSAGNGTLNITNEGFVFSTNVRIARESGSTGTVLIDGPESQWIATGMITMGLADTGTATLNVQNGGHLAAFGLTIGPLGTLRGDGTIEADVNSITGMVAPGRSPGTLHIIGDYQQSLGAALQIELASPTSFDKLDVSGNITLPFGSPAGGGTLEVSLIDGYVPQGSQSFDILDWGGNLSGAFDAVLLPTHGGTLVWDTSLLYTDGVLSVIGPAILTGDLNSDGFVGQDDLNIILGAWGQTVGEPGNWMLGDPSGDGFVGQSDLNDVLGNWGQGTPPMLASPVPEPQSRLLWITGIACSVVAGRQLGQRKKLITRG